jgi:DNA uptake protein ComE-like DNA-binding protein
MSDRRQCNRVGIVTAMVLMATVWSSAALAQVGKGLVEPNAATESQLLALPHVTPVIAKAIVAQRPFLSIVDFNKFLLGAGLTQAQASELYERAFVHVNLNTATAEEILLIPRAGKRMAHEFDEYRPWVNWAQFDKEIGKYVPQAEVDRLKQYVFIPMDINTASDEMMTTIPGATSRWLHEFKEYRPYKTAAQFEREIGKYLKDRPREVQRFWRYFVIK